MTIEASTAIRPEIENDAQSVVDPGYVLVSQVAAHTHQPSAVIDRPGHGAEIAGI